MEERVDTYLSCSTAFFAFALNETLNTMTLPGGKLSKWTSIVWPSDALLPLGMLQICQLTIKRALFTLCRNEAHA